VHVRWSIPEPEQELMAADLEEKDEAIIVEGALNQCGRNAWWTVLSLALRNSTRLGVIGLTAFGVHFHGDKKEHKKGQLGQVLPPTYLHEEVA
jgi:hypothetical protein